MRTGTFTRPNEIAPDQIARGMALVVGVRVLRAVAAGHRGPLAVVAARARGQALRRSDVDRVAAVGAAIGARGHVATRWNWLCHGRSSLVAAERVPVLSGC